MLFEEFFKKKKINLDILQKGEPELLSEFREHYAQMGEKSFDHTKKYWFNKLRRQYPLPPEVKEEKVHIENKLAEQTVADTLTEPTPNAEPAKLGFRPKFKAGTMAAPKPAEDAAAAQPSLPETAKPATSEDTPPAEQTGTAPAKMGFKPRFKAGVTANPATEGSTPEEPKTEQAEATSESAEQPAKLGFKPRFKAGVTTSKPAEESAGLEEPKAESAETPAEEPTGQPTAKLGFKPRFKAGVTTGKPAEESAAQEEPKAESAETSAETTDQPTAKLGFKPRFKAGVTTVKPAEEVPAVSETNTEDKADNSIDTTAETNTAPATPKLGFKPRFKAGVTTKSAEETAPLNEPEVKAAEEKAEEQPVAETTPGQPASQVPKLGFKPRFKAGVTTTKADDEIEAKAGAEVKADEPVADAAPKEEPTPETPVAKQPYKPRFNPNIMKPKPPAEGESE